MSLTKEQQRETYRRMLRIRKFEEEGTRLFKAGQIPGAYHASIGEEATRWRLHGSAGRRCNDRNAPLPWPSHWQRVRT